MIDKHRIVWFFSPALSPWMGLIMARKFEHHISRIAVAHCAIRIIVRNNWLVILTDEKASRAQDRDSVHCMDISGSD